MDLSLFAAEGGWQEFALKGGEWTVLLLSVVAALAGPRSSAFYLARRSWPPTRARPKMREIAAAIQEGALAYLKRQFRTIAVIVVPVAAIVFFTSTEILEPRRRVGPDVPAVRDVAHGRLRARAAWRRASPATSA